MSRLSPGNVMKQIRPNVFQVQYGELGSPGTKGYVDLPEGAGQLLLDEADMRYIRTSTDLGYEPTFFVKRSPALGGHWLVIARQWPDQGV